MATKTSTLLLDGSTMNEFEEQGCTIVRGFIDPQSIQTISQYMENTVKQEDMKRGDDKVATSYVRYADPLMEVILKNSQAHVEEITGKQLYPTYSYSRVYTKGDVLKPHVDRPSCEVSVTVNVATVGELWKIWMKAPGKEPVACTLEPGDAIVYKGCEVAHWREEAVNTEINAQFMLHYVDIHGPFASYKFDKRPALGTLQVTEGN